MAKLVFGVSLAMLAGLIVGVLAGGVYLAFMLGENLNTIKILFLLDYPPTLTRITQSPFRESYSIVLVSMAVAMLIAVILTAFDQLTQYGDARFQTMRDLRRNRMFAPVGSGLIFGRYCPPPAQHKGKPITISKRKRLIGLIPRKPGPFISADYDHFPNAMLIGPTGSGKSRHYAIPITFIFPGSLVILDVKGEIWDATARHRAAMGDKVLRFSPLDFINPTHQYNPLHRIAQFKDVEQQYTELQKIAGHFLQVEGASGKDFVSGGGELFIAAGLLAIERGNATFGEIYRIIYGRGDGESIGETVPARFLETARESRSPSVKQIFSEYARMDSRIRDSYLSVLKSAGLRQWSNPRVERVTRRNDIDFTTIRRMPQTIYLVVASDDLENLSSLIRLFFTELVASLRSRGGLSDTEPWPVKILLDEFDQLGHMPIFVKALKQLRGHGGRVSIITQSVPGLQTVYSKDEFESLLAGAGIKIYLTANEATTAKEIESSLGTRTGLAVSHSHDRGGFGLARGSVSKHSEDRPLLSEQQIKQLDNSKVIVLPEQQQPILADRIEYSTDPYLKKLYEAQSGSYPFPPEPDREVEELRIEVNLLTSKMKAMNNQAVEKEGSRSSPTSTFTEKKKTTAKKRTAAKVIPPKSRAESRKIKPTPEQIDTIRDDIGILANVAEQMNVD